MRILTLLAAAWLLSPASAVAADGIIILFDGKSLDGWTTSDGKPVAKGWKIEDDQLVRTERSGAIYAENPFEDFALEFEWKIAPKGNSGVKYRVRHYEKGVRGNPGWLGCEYQLYDDAKLKTSQSLSSSGALYSLFAPGKNKKVNPPDEFNKARIVVEGSRIEHWLNGEKIVEVDTESDTWKEQIAASKFAEIEGFGTTRRGRIQIQDHGSKVWFRNMTLRRLPDAEEAAGK
jgi:hypothetical protein